MIVNNGAVMRVKIKNNVMIDKVWLKPGEIVMIPNNKAVEEYDEEGLAEVVKWRKRKIPDAPKVGPKENTALHPVKETASISPQVKAKTIVVEMPKITKKEAVAARPGVSPSKKKATVPQKKRR